MSLLRRWYDHVPCTSNSFLRNRNWLIATSADRVSPLQKALVVKLVKKNLKAILLAIGDGANDVSIEEHGAELLLECEGETLSVWRDDRPCVSFKFSTPACSRSATARTTSR
jgi:hypothetical protein